MSRVLLALLVVLLAPAGCQGIPTGTGCSDIPAGGCPTDRGGTCDDPTCNALYACNAGAWSILQWCDQPDGGAGGGDAGGGDGGPRDGGPCTPVSINTTGETQDCTPDLEGTDCSVEAALGCEETACLTGCSDFYLCTAPGWVHVAYCDDNGDLIVTQ